MHLKPGPKDADLERLSNNPYRFSRLVMFRQMSQQMFCDTVPRPSITRQMLRNVELGLPTEPPEQLTHIFVAHSSASPYYQKRDELLSDYRAFQRHTRQSTGLILGPDRYLADNTSGPGYVFADLVPSDLGPTALATQMCYPLQLIQRLLDKNRVPPVGEALSRVLKDMGYSDLFIESLTKNHFAYRKAQRSSRKVTFS